MPCSTPPSGIPAGACWDEQGAGSVDDAIAELAHEANRLADRVAHVSRGRMGPHVHASRDTHADVSPLDLLWDAVDSAIADLKAAETTLREVRGRG